MLYSPNCFVLKCFFSLFPSVCRCLIIVSLLRYEVNILLIYAFKVYCIDLFLFMYYNNDRKCCWLAGLYPHQLATGKNSCTQHFTSKWVHITSIQYSHIHLRWKSWNWTKIMYYFTIIVINFGSIPSHFRASINFKIFSGENSGFE